MDSDMLFLFFGSSGAYEGRSDAGAPSLSTPLGEGYLCIGYLEGE